MNEKLGWILVHSLWQFTLWALFAIIFLKCLRRASSRLRYSGLVCVLLLMTLSPVVTWSFLSDAPQPVVQNERVVIEDVPPLVEPVPPEVPDQLPNLAPRIEVAASSSSSAHAEAVVETNHVSPHHEDPGWMTNWSTQIHQTLEPWLDWIVGIWFAGMLLFSLRLLSGWYTIRRLSGTGTIAVPENLQILLRETAQRLGIRQTVRILQSSLATVPLVTGFLRPLILLPASVVTGFPPAQLQAILAHELAHIRRYDQFVNLWQTLVETIFFYHPLVWWLSRQIRCERENCCDDLAVSITGSNVEYSHALLALDELRDASPALALSSHGGSLTSRIKRLVIVEPKENRSGFLAIIAVLILLIGMTTSFLWWNADGQNTATANAESAIQSELPMSAEARRVSADEPTFGPESHGLQFPDAEAEPAPKNLHGGAVVQRQRIDDFIQRVGAASVNDLEQSLADFELTVFVPGIGPGFDDDVNHLPAVLSDRRVARLYREYESLGSASRDRVEILAEYWLKEHTARITRVVDQWKERSSIDISVDLGGSNHACAAAAFLLCSFADIEATLSFLRRWEEAAQLAIANVDPSRNPLEINTAPGDLYALNLCLVYAQRRLKADDFKQRVEQQVKLPFVCLTEAPHSEWDAHTTAFDFTHVNKGIPTDKEKVIAQIIYLNSFGTAGAHSTTARQGLRERAIQLVSTLNEDSPHPEEANADVPTFGPESHGLQFRLVALSPEVNDESPDLKREMNNYTRSANVTFGVELKNVSEKKLTLAGIRYGESYVESVRGKLRTKLFAPHFFEFEFFDRDGKPLPRTQREFYQGWHVADGASVHELNPGESLVEVLRPAKFNVPMNYDFAPGNYSVRVRYRGLSESVRTFVRKHWPDKPILDAWPHQVDSNPVQFSVAEHSNRIRPEDLKWGKPVDGLRAALEYRLPPGVEGNPMSAPGVPVDTSLGVVFHVQNVSVDPITFVSETGRQGDTVHVTNERGEKVEVKGAWFSGAPIDVAWTLQPGETAQLHVLAPAINSIDQPGRYTVRYTVRFNSRGSKDADGNVIFPRPGDYQSEVDTGETPLVLYEPSLKVPKNSESPPSNPEHNEDSSDSEEANAAESAIPVLERKVSLIANKMPLRDALRELARQAGVEVVFEESYLEKVQLDLDKSVNPKIRDLPLYEALSDLLYLPRVMTSNVIYEIRDGKLWLTTFEARSDRIREHLPEWLKPMHGNGVVARLDDNNKVEELYLGNQLTDELLTKLTTLPRLRKLDIQVTSQISATGIKHLAELKNLQELNLYGSLEDEVPGDEILKYITGLKELRELSIGQCGITDEGLKHLEQMPQLTSLQLDNEGLLTDACLSSIAKLENLQTLSMSSLVATARYGWMRFNSEALTQLSTLRNLEHLHLVGQQFPSDAFAFTKLKSLSVSGYDVDDEFVKKLKLCPELRSLNFWNTPVTDAGLKMITELPELRKLSLFGLPVTDVGLRELQNSPHLENLELRNVGISDTGIGYVGKINTLTRLDLYACTRTTAGGLEQLKSLPKLRTLYLTNFPDKSGYRGLSQLKQLRELSFMACGILNEDWERLKTEMPRTQIHHMTGGGSFSMWKPDVPKRKVELPKLPQDLQREAEQQSIIPFKPPEEDPVEAEEGFIPRRPRVPVEQSNPGTEDPEANENNIPIL